MPFISQQACPSAINWPSTPPPKSSQICIRFGFSQTFQRTKKVLSRTRHSTIIGNNNQTIKVSQIDLQTQNCQGCQNFRPAAQFVGQFDPETCALNDFNLIFSLFSVNYLSASATIKDPVLAAKSGGGTRWKPRNAATWIRKNDWDVTLFNFSTVIWAKVRRD